MTKEQYLLAVFKYLVDHYGPVLAAETFTTAYDYDSYVDTWKLLGHGYESAMYAISNGNTVNWDEYIHAGAEWAYTYL